MIESDYDKIIKNLPDIIHLSKFDGFKFNFELDYKQDNIYKEELRKVTYGTLLKINKYVNEGIM